MLLLKVHEDMLLSVCSSISNNAPPIYARSLMTCLASPNEVDFCYV